MQPNAFLSQNWLLANRPPIGSDLNFNWSLSGSCGINCENCRFSRKYILWLQSCAVCSNFSSICFRLSIPGCNRDLEWRPWNVLITKFDANIIVAFLCWNIVNAAGTIIVVQTSDFSFFWTFY